MISSVLQPARYLARTPRLVELKNATDQFESALVKQMFSSMHSMVEKNKIGQSYGGDMFQDMFDSHFATASKRQMNLGLSDQMFKNLAPIAINQASPKAIPPRS